jgi:hypothetical protein
MEASLRPRNRILVNLSAADFDLVKPHLQDIDLVHTNSPTQPMHRRRCPFRRDLGSFPGGQANDQRNYATVGEVGIDQFVAGDCKFCCMNKFNGPQCGANQFKIAKAEISQQAIWVSAVSYPSLSPRPMSGTEQNAYSCASQRISPWQPLRTIETEQSKRFVLREIVPIRS